MRDTVVAAVGSGPRASTMDKAGEPERIQGTLGPDERRENNHKIERQHQSIQHKLGTATSVLGGNRDLLRGFRGGSGRRGEGERKLVDRLRHDPIDLWLTVLGKIYQR